jgi:hypothetical protein
VLFPSQWGIIAMFEPIPGVCRCAGFQGLPDRSPNTLAHMRLGRLRCCLERARAVLPGRHVRRGVGQEAQLCLTTGQRLLQAHHIVSRQVMQHHHLSGGHGWPEQPLHRESKTLVSRTSSTVMTAGAPWTKAPMIGADLLSCWGTMPTSRSRVGIRPSSRLIASSTSDSIPPLNCRRPCAVIRLR